MDKASKQEALSEHIKNIAAIVTNDTATVTRIDNGVDISSSDAASDVDLAATHIVSQCMDYFYDSEAKSPCISLAVFSFFEIEDTNNHTTIRISLDHPTSESTSSNPSSQVVKGPNSILLVQHHIVNLINKIAEMTEPRARAARHKGQMNFEVELTQMLYAFGDDVDPLEETVRVLDEIVTDFIIETSHTAAKAAEVSGRTKLKADDFKFAIRKDEVATGRVKELTALDKDLKETRKALDDTEGRQGLERGGRKKKEEVGSEVGSVKKGEKEKGKGKELPREVADDEELGDEDDIDE